MTPTREGLECAIGPASVVVPVEAMQQIVECYAAPVPPMCHPWVAGLGVYEDKVFPCVALFARDASESSQPRRELKGVLMDGRGGPSWILEIDTVRSLLKASVVAGEDIQVTGLVCPSSWLVAASTGDGRSLAWLDVPAVSEALGELAAGN